MSLPSFAELEVSADLQKILERQGFEGPVPVQTAVMMAVNSGRSAVIAAPAWSGRGTSLALAAASLVARQSEGIRVIVVAGTRSRVFQLSELIGTLAVGRKAAPVATLVSGQSTARRAALLEKGPGIVVATPGVIRQALHDQALSLDSVAGLLIDGTDEQLENGMDEDLEAVLAALPPGRTVVALCSVLSRDLEALASRRLPEADRLVSEPAATPANLTWFSLEAAEKFQSLTVLADRHDLSRAVVLVNNRLAAETLADRLSAAGYSAEALHSGSSATVRDRAVKRFRQGSVSFLVGTARGLSDLELEPVDTAIHYDWPLDDAEFALRHRHLRSGGLAFALAAGRELVRARSISRRGSPVRLGRLPLLGELAELRLHANVSRIREALSGRNPAACRSVVDLLMAEGFEPAVIAGAAIRLLGAPELPPLPPPPPPVMSERTAVAEVAPAAAPAPAPAVAPAYREDTIPMEAEPTGYEAADWSPGVGSGVAVDDGDTRGGSASGSASGEGDYEPSGDSGYTYSDNAAEDGVVYPPGANFGDDEPGMETGGDDRSGRRGRRGGRGRGRAGGGGGGGEGGPASAGMRRLWLNVGRMDRIQPRDIVGCILGETGLPSATVGRVQLFERHTLVDVSVTFESQILEALNRAAVRGRKLKAKIAAY
jgi:ATP-dependent RNA helicase DeaD